MGLNVFETLWQEEVWSEERGILMHTLKSIYMPISGIPERYKAVKHTDYMAVL